MRREKIFHIISWEGKISFDKLEANIIYVVSDFILREAIDAEHYTNFPSEEVFVGKTEVCCSVVGLAETHVFKFCCPEVALSSGDK